MPVLFCLFVCFFCLFFVFCFFYICCENKYTMKINTVIHYSERTLIRGLGKKHKFLDSWIRGFMVFSIHFKGNLLWNQISWFCLPMKTSKIGTSRTIVLSQYFITGSWKIWSVFSLWFIVYVLSFTLHPHQSF